MSWTIKIIDSPYSFSRDVYIFRKSANGIEVLENDALVLYPEGCALPSKPAIKLDQEALQELADELGRAGYKPEKGLAQGKLEAMTQHLEDMRRLVFSNIKK